MSYLRLRRLKAHVEAVAAHHVLISRKTARLNTGATSSYTTIGRHKHLDFSAMRRTEQEGAAQTLAWVSIDGKRRIYIVASPMRVVDCSDLGPQPTARDDSSEAVRKR